MFLEPYSIAGIGNTREMGLMMIIRKRKGGSSRTRENFARDHGLTPSRELGSGRCIINSWHWEFPLNYFLLCPICSEDIQFNLKEHCLDKQPYRWIEHYSRI